MMDLNEAIKARGLQLSGGHVNPVRLAQAVEVIQSHAPSAKADYTAVNDLQVELLEAACAAQKSRWRRRK